MAVANRVVPTFEEIKSDDEPVAVFFNARYPNERVIYRDEIGAPNSFDLQFQDGMLVVMDEDDAEFIRRAVGKTGRVFEGKKGDGVRCPLCQERGRMPITLNAPALAQHMKFAHE
jgi:hypothetical protein